MQKENNNQVLKNSDLNIKSLFKDFGMGETDVMLCFKRAFIDALINKYPSTTEQDFCIDFGEKYNYISIAQKLEVVNDKNFQPDNKHIKLNEAKKIKKNAVVGEVVEKPIDLKNSFDMNDISLLKKKLAQYIRFGKTKNFYVEYKKKIGNLINVRIYKSCKGYDIVQDEEGNELYLYNSELGDIDNNFKKNKNSKDKTFKVYVKAIENKKGKIMVLVSREGNYFIQKLLEENIPETTVGTVIVKKIVRDIALRKTKVVVDTVDESVDPIGACLGINKCRINAILSELNNETVDFVRYNSDIAVFIANALTIPSVKEIIETENCIFIYVQKDYLKLAIGHKGSNIKLLRLLLNDGKANRKTIEIFEYTEKNMSFGVDELRGYFDNWIVDTLKTKGIKTIIDITKYNPEEFERIFDFETETVHNIFIFVKQILENNKKNRETE